MIVPWSVLIVTGIILIIALVALFMLIEIRREKENDNDDIY